MHLQILTKSFTSICCKLFSFKLEKFQLFLSIINIIWCIRREKYFQDRPFSSLLYKRLTSTDHVSFYCFERNNLISSHLRLRWLWPLSPILNLGEQRQLLPTRWHCLNRAAQRFTGGKPGLRKYVSTQPRPAGTHNWASASVTSSSRSVVRSTKSTQFTARTFIVFFFFQCLYCCPFFASWNDLY